MNQDLGYIPPFDPTKSPAPERPAVFGFLDKAPFLPRKLKFISYDSSVSPKEMEAKYDRWRIKITRPCSLGYGRFAETGQTLEISGDIAAMLVVQGQAEWCDDPKINAELEAISKARELGIPLATYQKLDLTREKPPKKWALS